MMIVVVDTKRRSKMKLFFVPVLATLIFSSTASAQQTTFRDGSGRLIGTSSTDSNGTRTVRDASGRTTETSTTNSNGTTTYRDGSGRTIGTSERHR
jgi:YD repeat-containing protein